MLTLSEVYSLSLILKKTSKTLDKIKLLTLFLEKKDIDDIKYLLFLIDSKHPVKKNINVSKKTFLKIFYAIYNFNKTEFYKIYGKDKAIDISKIWLDFTNINVNKSLISLTKSDPLLKEIWMFYKKLENIKGKKSMLFKTDLIKNYLLTLDVTHVPLFISFFINEKRFGVDLKLFFRTLASLYNLESKTLENNYYKLYFEENINFINNVESIYQPFVPFKLMLASTFKESVFNKLLETEKYIYELKYDGIRAQIHIFEQKIKIFSRNFTDLTASFINFLNVYFKNFEKNVILDVEIIGLNFQDLSKIFKRKYKLDLYKTKIDFKIFDILYYNVILIDKKLYERKQILNLVLKNTLLEKKQVAFIEINNSTNLKQILDNEFKKGHEGLILKNYNSLYLSGQRTNDWIKIKHDTETGDFVIIGCIRGHGLKEEYYTSFLVAVNDQNVLKEVGFVGSGFKIQDLKELTNMLNSLILDQKEEILYVEPKIVLELNFQSLQKSEIYSSKISLRFPSFKAIRFDKNKEDINTLSQILEIYELYK